MKIWLARHGQTDYNRNRLMQGRVDVPLNETGIRQAEAVREKIFTQYPELAFDVVYTSPLIRAVQTAAILGGIPEEAAVRDERIIEVAFGNYEKMKYSRLGIRMSLYWAFPEIFPPPPTVEDVASMKARSRAFLSELEQEPYENVLVACHGGILRALWGYMEDKRNGLRWRPKPKNCEVRVYESGPEGHRFVESFAFKE